jgi:hypothetical protein
MTRHPGAQFPSSMVVLASASQEMAAIWTTVGGDSFLYSSNSRNHRMHGRLREATAMLLVGMLDSPCSIRGVRSTTPAI